MTNIQRELVEAEEIIFDELLASGYPKESIMLEGKTDSRRFVDFLIIDVDTELPMMMIEVKSCSAKTRIAVRKMAFESLKRNYEEVSFPMKAVCAVLDREQKKLEFVDFTKAIKEKDFNQAVNNYHLPSYELLTIGARQKALDKHRKDQEKKIVALKWLCWLFLPLVCVGLVFLDAFDVYTLSSLRLITIGAGAAGTLIPCFKKIRLGEIVIKMISDKPQRESNDT